MSSARSSNGPSKPGSLTNVVQSLVRAQYGLTAREASNSGASAPNGKAGESETDLDRHVAELLLKEAKEREERAKKENVGYWRLSDDEGEQQYQSKTNKRFLKTIIQNVEEHNKPLIRPAGTSRKEELDAIRARDRAERERRTGVKDAERLHRKTVEDSNDKVAESSSSRRAAPGFAARSLAIGLSGARDLKKQEDRKRQDLDEAISEARDRAQKDDYVGSTDKGKGRAVSQDSDEQLTKRRRSPSPQAGRREKRRSRSLEREEHRRSRREDPSDRKGERPRRRSRDRRRQRSPSEDRTWARRLRSPERERDRRHSPREDSTRQRSGRYDRSRSHRDREDANSRSRKCSQERSPTDSEADSSDTFIDTTEAGPSAAASKMDKYFTESYNPALDVSVDDLTDPSTGLIAEGNFSEWDKMLHILKKRKEDKIFGVTQAREEERERQLRKLEKRKRKEEREVRRALRKDKKRKKRRRDGSDSEDSASSDDSVGPKMRIESVREAGTVKVGDYEYGRKGTVRAWDMGKDATF